jgi:hypothetical protein
MLLQHIKEQYGNHPDHVLFVSLDNIYFSSEICIHWLMNFMLRRKRIIFGRST